MIKNRIFIFLFTITIPAAAVFLSAFADINRPLHQWHIAEGPGRFYDTRQFAMGAESYYQGYDPLIENPANDRGQRLTYPRIWHVLFPLVVDQSRTNIMGSIVVIIFFIGLGIFWFSTKFDNLTYFILSVITLSPPVMLGIERANNELIIFFILSLALTVDYYSRIGGLSLFLFASILKFQPVLGFIYLIKEEKRKFWILFLSALGLFALYMYWIKDDLHYVFTAISQGVSSSYGINVWWKAIGHRRYFNLPLSESTQMIFHVLSYILAATIIIVTLYLSIRQKNNETCRQSRYIDAFRVGAAIYTGSFLLLTNNDYRLVFMIFTVPQLVDWMRNKEHPLAFASRITMSVMVLSLWSNLIMRYLGRKTSFVIEVPANWVMFAGLLYLLFSSHPSWLSDYVRRLFFFIKR
jgi:hypothetical protein